jgi:hypothetical protein
MYSAARVSVLESRSPAPCHCRSPRGVLPGRMAISRNQPCPRLPPSTAFRRPNGVTLGVKFKRQWTVRSPKVAACRLYYSPHYSPTGRLRWRIRTPSCLRRACRMQRIGLRRARGFAPQGNAVATCLASRSAACRNGAWRRALSAATLRCYHPSPRLHEHPRYRQDRARAGGTSSRCPCCPCEVSPVRCWSGGGDSSRCSRGTALPQAVSRDTPGDHADVLTMRSHCTLTVLSGGGASASDVECGIGAVLATLCCA